jgi:hypothetical protein
LHTNFTLGTKIDPVTLAADKASLQAYLDRNIVAAPIKTALDPASLAASKASIEAYMSGIPAGLDFKLDPVKLLGVKAGIDRFLSSNTVTIPVQANTTQAVSRLEGLEADTSVLQTRLMNLRAEVNDVGAEAKIAALQVQAAAFAKTLAGAGKGADFEPLEASLLGMQSSYAKLIAAQEAEDEEIKRQTGFFGALGLAGPGSLIHITDILNASLPAVKLFGGAIGDMYATIRGGDAELPTVANHLFNLASSAHLTAEAAIEFTAIWAPAIIAVTAFGLAATPTVITIGKQLQNMNTAAKGTGQAFASLATQGEHVTAAVKPAVLELFGEGLEALKNDSGTLGPILAALGSGFDRLGAQAVVAFGSGGSGGIFKSGSADALALANSFTALGSIAGTFFKLVPGYAEILLGFGNDVLGASADVLKFVEPVLKIGVALHGAIFYGGLFGTAVGAGLNKLVPVAASVAGGIANLAGKFELLGGESGKLATGAADAATALDGIAGGPVIVGLALLAGAVAAVVLYMKAASDSAAAFNKSIQSTVQSASVLNLQKAITTGLTETTVQYTAALKNVAQANNTAAASAGSVQFRYSGVTTAQQAATTAAGEYQGALSQLTTQQTNVNSNLQALADTFHTTLPGALAIANGAQITSNQLMGSGAQNIATIKAQAVGYADQLAVMTAGTGTLNQALNALSVTQSAQVTDAQKLAQAYASWIGIVTGGDSAFTSFEQSQQTLVDTLGGKVTPAVVTATTASTRAGQSITALGGTSSTASSSLTKLAKGGSDVTTSLSNTAKGGQDVTNSLDTTTSATTKAASAADTLSVKVGNITEKFDLAGAAMNGTSVASLAARQAFDQQIVSATSLYGALQTMAAASGNNATAQVALAKSGKDLVAQMLPLAAGSKEATAEVYALAQIAGYAGPDSFQKLAQWVGNTSNAESDLNTQQTILTLSTANLTAAAKNLATAVSQEITQAEAAAIAKTEDFSNTTLKLAQAFQASDDSANSAVTTLSGTFYSSLIKAGDQTKDATQQVNAFLSQLGASPEVISQVDASLAKLPDGTQQAVNAMKSLNDASQANLATLRSIPGTLATNTASYNELFNAIVKEDQGLVNNTSQADTTKAAFIAFAEQGLNLTSSAAAKLWATQNAQNLVATASKASTTENAFIAMAKSGLNLSTSSAQTLWNTLRLQYLDTLVTKGKGAESQFIALAKSGLDLTTSSATQLWNTLKQQYLDTLASKSTETEKSFEATAKQLGLTKTAADQLWTSMHTLAAGSPYSANVNATISATGEVQAIESSGAAANIVNAALGDLHFSAAGGTVPGGVHGQDSVHAVLAPGELVIPSQHAPKFADMARKASIPGFAAGGTVAAGIDAIVPTSVKDTGQFATSTIAAFVKNVQGAMTALLAAPGNTLAYEPVVLNVMKMLDIPLTDLSAIMQQMATESGGNPLAVNNSDSNAAAGTPSTGLFQVIAPTFDAFAGPFRNTGPFLNGVSVNPTANTYAGLNYAIHRYGIGNLTSVLGQGHGYSSGGMVNEPVLGVGLNSGTPYSFAERGSEYVGPISGNGTSNSGLPGMSSYQASTLISLMQQQNKLLAQMPYSQAQAINQANATGVRRGYFATSG